MKRPLIVLSALLFVALIAGGQEHHPLSSSAEHAKLADYLQLTADQRTAWESLHSELANTVAPLRLQARGAHQQLATLLDSDSPDPTAVGNQVIAIHALEKQIQAAHDATEQKVGALLTPDQKTKFDAWRATRPGMMAIESTAVCDPSCPVVH